MKACQPKIWGKTEEKHDNVDDIDDDCDFEGADNEDHGDVDRDLKEKHTSNIWKHTVEKS